MLVGGGVVAETLTGLTTGLTTPSTDKSLWSAVMACATQNARAHHPCCVLHALVLKRGSLLLQLLYRTASERDVSVTASGNASRSRDFLLVTWQLAAGSAAM